MSRFTRTALWIGLGLGTFLVYVSLRSLALMAGPFGAVFDQISTFTTIFLGIFIEAAPFLLLGTLASGLVEAFVNQDDLSRWIPRDPVRGAIAGSLMGLFFPVCECGVVPLVRRLFRKGLPLPVGVAFLLAAPVVNPIVFASTLAAFGFGRVLIGRFALTISIAVVTGLVFAAQRQPQRLLRPAAWPAMAGASGPAAGAPAALFVRPAFRPGLRRALTVTADEFFEMGRYLVLGALWLR